MAWPTWATSPFCSSLAALISETMSVTRRMDCTISVMGAARTVGLGGAALDLLDAVGDQSLDLLGGIRTALGQVAHLGGHDGKPAPLLTGLRRFHGRVQSQDVGLEGDAVDDTNDVGDAA